MTVTETPASAANTEATEDGGTEDFLKKNLFFSSVRQQMQDDGGAGGSQHTWVQSFLKILLHNYSVKILPSKIYLGDCVDF